MRKVEYYVLIKILFSNALFISMCSFKRSAQLERPSITTGSRLRFRLQTAYSGIHKYFLLFETFTAKSKAKTDGVSVVYIKHPVSN